MNFHKKDHWDAQFYKKNSSGQFASAMSEIQKIKFRGDEQVLDVGCGDGRVTYEIAKLVPNGSVLGIDLSANMVDEAKKSFGDIKNLLFQNVDASKFESDKKFDLVVSFAAFHWMKDQLLVLKNIFNVLKTGGKLIIKMGAYHKNPVSEMLVNPKWLPLLKNHEKTYFHRTVKEFSEMLEMCGFEKTNVKLEVSKRTFQNKEELFNFAYAWIPASTGLPEDKAREFARDIVDGVCAENKNGELILESARLLAKAEKNI